MEGAQIDRLLRDVLERYVSRLNVDAILRRVYAAEKIAPEKLTQEDLERIFQNSLFGAIRMFSEPRELSTIMLDLAELMEKLPEQKRIS